MQERLNSNQRCREVLFMEHFVVGNCQKGFYMKSKAKIGPFILKLVVLTIGLGLGGFCLLIVRALTQEFVMALCKLPPKIGPVESFLFSL